MSKPIVAVDIDDVLVPHAEQLLGYINHTYGTDIPFSRFFSLDEIIRLTGTTEASLAGQVHRFLESVEFSGIQPVREAVVAIGELQPKYDFHVITARPGIVKTITEDWLERHFPDVFREVHFVNARYSWGHGFDTPKATVCQQTGISYLVDDNLNHVVEASACGIRGLLFGDYPWNQAERLPGGVSRVKDWQEIQEVLLGKDS